MDHKIPHVKIQNLEGAVPELHTDEFEKKQKEIEEEENRLLNEQTITNEFVTVPEVHFHRKKKAQDSSK